MTAFGRKRSVDPGCSLALDYEVRLASGKSPHLEFLPVTLKAGDSLFIPAGVAHIAKNVGNEKGSELATYIVKKGEPLLILK